MGYKESDTTEVAERTCTLAVLEGCDWCVLGFFNTAAAAETAKSPQPCPTLCAPMDSSPPGSSVHGIL